MYYFKNIKFILLTFSFLFVYTTAKSQNSQKRKHKITGKVTHNKVPLSDTHIVIKNSRRATKTDYFGNYSLRASYNDTLQFTYMGYSTIEIIVRNKKSINVEMIPEFFALEETLIKNVKRKRESISEEYRPFKTAMGVIRPRGAAYRISYFKGDVISRAPTISRALLGRVPNYRLGTRTGQEVSYIRGRRAIWDVDGFVTDEEPLINLDEVLDVRVLFSPEVALRYGGMRSAGGVIVVRTKNGRHEENIDPVKQERITKILNNVKKEEKPENATDYNETVRNFDDIVKAYNYCRKILNKNKKQYFTDLSLANTFLDYYGNKYLFTKLTNIYQGKYSENLRALQALTFELESLDLKNEYLSLYKRIYRLDYKNPKSYRDLANAFIHNNDHEKAWRLYLSYLRKNQDYYNKDIGKLIFNEMEWLYHNKKHNPTSLFKFTPKHDSKHDFSKDVRIVIEWNNPEVSFNLNFNNNSNIKKSISFQYDHEKSKYKNEPLIKEFFIADLKENEWDIDLTYFGNKEEKKATSFKATYYYNWGKQNESKKIKTFLLNGDFVNRELFTVSQIN